MTFVLAVDDDPAILRTLGINLRARDYDVETAGDGRSALQIVDERMPDVILLDLGLPDLDGVEVGRRIRALADGAGILLVALSGHGGQDDLAATRAAGFDAHLVKPVDPGRIVALLGARRAPAADPGTPIAATWSKTR